MVSATLTTPGSGRLLTIDLLRGIAAIAVMLFHALGLGIFVHAGELRLPQSWVDGGIFPVSFGFAGVYLFFVISGFCIHLRWVKNQVRGGGEQPLEFVAFWKRRFRRLYPAYLIALFLFIAAQWQLGNINFNSFFAWDLISHLLMLHNLDARTVYSLNGVFWTLAIEEQLYLAYFLLIWMRKTYGWRIAIMVTFGARIIWFAFAFIVIRGLNVQMPILESSMANWFIWALGALAVEARYGIIKLPSWCYSGLLAAVVLLSTCTIYIYEWVNAGAGLTGRASTFILQPMWGIGFFILVNKVVTLEGSFTRAAAAIVRLLAWVGLFSYSLYLTHELVFLYIPNVAWPIKALFSLFFAWLFYLCFEKPFMHLSRPKLIQEAVA
jgi:peptidoglycan/LPS O-acetylase OafA/YrhL